MARSAAATMVRIAGAAAIVALVAIVEEVSAEVVVAVFVEVVAGANGKGAIPGVAVTSATRWPRTQLGRCQRMSLTHKRPAACAKLIGNDLFE